MSGIRVMLVALLKGVLYKIAINVVRQSYGRGAQGGVTF